MTVITKTNATDERTQISDALTSVEADVATNTADIATNTADIATNTAAISALDARVTALEGGVDGTPPTSLAGRRTDNADLEANVNITDGANDTTASVSTYDVWTELLGVTTTSGVIEFLNVWQSANASDLNWAAKLLVDGTEVWASATDAWRLGAENGDGFYLIGTGGTSASAAGGAIAFSASFSLQFKKTENAAGTVTAGAQYSYRVTG